MALKFKYAFGCKIINLNFILKYFGLFRCAIWWVFIDVSEVRAASIIEAVRLHGATMWKTAIFTLVVLETSNLIKFYITGYLWL